MMYLPVLLKEKSLPKKIGSVFSMDLLTHENETKESPGIISELYEKLTPESFSMWVRTFSIFSLAT